MADSRRHDLLRLVALCGKGSTGFQAQFNPKEGGHVYFPADQVRLFLREDMACLDSAIVDAPAIEILLERIARNLGAVQFDFGEAEEGWAFRAFRRDGEAIVEVARGEGLSRAEAVAYAYAQAFAPKEAV